MRIRNPFKRRETVAELIEKLRPIVSKYGFPEAYVSYEGQKDINTDRPEWIRLIVPIFPGHTSEKHMSFYEELFDVFGDRVSPRPFHLDDEKMEYARSHYVSVFSQDKNKPEQ